MGNPKTPLASSTPNNPTKEFGHLHEIQNIYLDLASFPQFPPNPLFICYKMRYEVYKKI